MRYARGHDAIIDCDKQAERYGMTRQEYDKAYPFSNSEKADNIEDLCDKFVIAWSNATYYEIYDNFEDVENWYHGEGVTAIYGAIWTNKGLVFVAQLKERKLELL